MTKKTVYLEGVIHFYATVDLTPEDVGYSKKLEELTDEFNDGLKALAQEQIESVNNLGNGYSMSFVTSATAEEGAE